MSEKILVQVDKTVVRITGVKIKGLRIQQLETLLREALHSLVRVIGVTGDSVEMDVYGLPEEAVRRASDGIITAVSLTDGITPDDVIRLDSVETIRNAALDAIPAWNPAQCMKERWLS